MRVKGILIRKRFNASSFKNPSTLCWFCFIELVLAKHVKASMFKEHTDMVRDPAKVATMLVTVRVLTTQDVNSLDEAWMMGSAMILAGRSYHLVTKNLSALLEELVTGTNLMTGLKLVLC